MADRPDVPVESIAAWRSWLVEHSPSSAGCWAVTWRKDSGRLVVPYAALVEQALCVGWVDSRPRKVDAERTALLFTPRKAGSGWSRPNKERVVRLRRDGLMLPAGEAVVTAAVADGSWTKLDLVEDLVEPPDLVRALDADPAARTNWDAFPRSAKRGILEWIVQAKREQTRSGRIEQTVAAARVGERANQWSPKP